jgi:hypothetical protein
MNAKETMQRIKEWAERHGIPSRLIIGVNNALLEANT